MAIPYQLPETGYLRIWSIVGDPKAEPPIPAILPISRTSFLNGVKSGKYPKPIKLGERTTAWKVSDIRDLVEQINNTEYTPNKNVCKKVVKLSTADDSIFGKPE
jgi:prophage regulatory protein